MLQIGEGGRDGNFPFFLFFAHGRLLKVHPDPSSILSCIQSLDPVVRAEKKHLMASNKNQKPLHVKCITDKIGFETCEPSTYGSY